MVTRIALRRAAILFLAGLLSAKATEVHAAGEMWTAGGLITRIEAGWREETLSVEHTAPIVNPGNCPETRFGYATDPADPGRSLFHTVAEKAFQNRKDVQLLIAGCADVYGKPKIIAVKMFLTTTLPLPSLPPPPTVPDASCTKKKSVETVNDPISLAGVLEKNPPFEGTILIPAGPDMNFGSLRKRRRDLGLAVPLEIKKCVTLKGTRGGLDPGRLLLTGEPNPKSENSAQDPLFLITGNNVRIEGLRFQGPVVTYKEEDRAPTSGFDTAVHIKDAYNVVIENNDFSFWNQAVLVNPPRMTPRQANLIRITRNYFHRNANERHGYGVVLGDGDGYVAIEGNLFTHNRHAVSASGPGPGGYIARYNYVLEGGFTVCWPCYWNQHFDVHGAKPGGYGGRAREYFEIAYNTIRGEQQYYILTPQSRPAFMLRGKPTIGASFHENVVVHNNLDAAVALVDTPPPNTGIGEDHSKFNFVPGVPDRNVYNTDTSSDFAVGDFDGDGRDDVFLANGTGWWYSSAGKTEWRFLRASPLRIKDLRFGRFDSDAKTDVLFIDGDWYVWSAGEITPKRVRGDGTRLTDCVFGDFDGDGITDALRANGTTWSVAPAAQGPWILKRNSRVAAVNLRTGDFMGAGHDQIFWIDDAWSLWDPVSNAETGDHRNPLRRSDFASLVVADFDGDGTADVAQTKGSGWRWIRGGTNTWAPLRGAAGQYYYKNIREVVLGRFTPGDRRLDAVRYEMLPDPYRQQPSPFIPGRNFVVWKGFGSPDAFEPWTPPLQEMR